MICESSGDVFFYDFFKERWEAIYNVGFHQSNGKNFNNCILGIEQNLQFLNNQKTKLFADHQVDYLDLKKCPKCHYLVQGFDKSPIRIYYL